MVDIHSVINRIMIRHSCESRNPGKHWIPGQARNDKKGKTYVVLYKIICFLKTLTEKQCFLLLLGITFGLRLYAVLMAKGIAYDGAGYGFMARDFLRHDFEKGLSTALHPFYPFLIYLVSPSPHYVEIAGRFISLFFGTLTFIPVFYFVRETAGQKGAIFSGLFYAFHPYLVTYSGMLLSEATYWGLLTLSVYFFWTGLKQKRILRTIASGGFLALSYLTRPEAIGYLFIFLIWLIIDDGVTREWFKKYFLTGGIILVFFVISLPYLIYIHRETGQWLITKKGVAVQSQVLNWVEIKIDRPPERVIGGKESTHASRVKEKSPKILEIIKNILRYIPFTTYHYLRAYHFTLWLFLLFGLIRMRRGRAKEQWFLASFVLFHLFSLSTFTGSGIRYSVPLIPISLFWAGVGVLGFRKFLGKRNISEPGKWVSIIIVLFILIQLPQSLTPERRHRAEQKKVGLWLKKNTPQDAIIMSNSPIEAFYGEREFVPMLLGLYTFGAPGKSYKEIIQFVREKGVKYILVNKYTHEMNPDFKESIQSTDLKEIYRYKEKDGNLIIVYEVVY
jgi:hypothetical protein